MYKIITNSGETYNVSEVNEDGSFIVFRDGGREVRLPTSNIKKIESTDNAGVIIGGLIVMALTGGLG